jgi:predicted amidohydrolase
MRDMHVACGQFAAEPANKGNNIAQMIGYARDARDLGCELILFPELIVTGYLAPPEIAPLAEPLDGPSVQTLSKAACKLGIAIAFGFAELDERQQARYNALIVLDSQGQIAGHYHKMHLWDTEKQWAQSGDRAALFQVGGIPCSGWICYDTRFPELARLAALGRADLCLVPTAWLGPGEEWKLALRARALDNSVFAAGADILSTDPALRCQGLSLIVDPRGTILAEAEPGQEGIIHAVLSGDVLAAQRRRVPLLRDRQPNLYRALIG